MKTEYKQVQNMSTPVCEGFVEKKKSDQRRIPIGPSWKKRYCVLSSDGIRLYNSKSNYLCGVSETRVIAMCHVKSVRQTSSLMSDGCNFSYFDLETERGSKISFRFKDKIAWSALIQIELIKYKNKQDMAQYKRLYRNNGPYTGTVPPVRCTCHASCGSSINQVYNTDIRKCKNDQGLKTVVLPHHRNSGIGISVRDTHDGRVFINRLIDGSVADFHGDIYPGDEIVLMNGRLISNVKMFQDILNSSSSIRLQIRTSDSQMQLTNTRDPDVMQEKWFANYRHTMVTKMDDLKKGLVHSLVIVLIIY